MNENKVSESQKAAQKKYDQKTKMVSVKYTPADMSDYDRMERYVKETKQTVNGFIKKLVNSFFELGYDKEAKPTPTPKEYEKDEHWKYAGIGDECFEKLKSILNNDEVKYNIILDMYADQVKDEVDNALEERGFEFEEWVDSLEEILEDGNINLETEKQFKKDVEASMCDYIRGIYY